MKFDTSPSNNTRSTTRLLMLVGVAACGVLLIWVGSHYLWFQTEAPLHRKDDKPVLQPSPRRPFSKRGGQHDRKSSSLSQEAEFKILQQNMTSLLSSLNRSIKGANREDVEQYAQVIDSQIAELDKHVSDRQKEMQNYIGSATPHDAQELRRQRDYIFSLNQATALLDILQDPALSPWIEATLSTDSASIVDITRVVKATASKAGLKVPDWRPQNEDSLSELKTYLEQIEPLFLGASESAVQSNAHFSQVEPDYFRLMTAGGLLRHYKTSWLRSYADSGFTQRAETAAKLYRKTLEQWSRLPQNLQQENSAWINSLKDQWAAVQNSPLGKGL